MNLFFDYSHFQSSKKNKNFVSTSLKKFIKSPLGQIEKKDLEETKKIWKDLKKDHSPILVFAFGGSGSTKKILSSFFPSKNNNTFLIDAVNKKNLDYLSSLTKKELKSSHSLFFSKSGKTEEILFYGSLLKKIYTKKQLSLKKRFTIISQTNDNPLSKWAKKEGGSIILSKSELPGRFSFFHFNGLLQSQIYKKHFKIAGYEETSVQLKKALEFFFHYSKKKEIFFCPFLPMLEEVSHWLELSWSESLFKKEAVQQAPLLRKVSLPDLRHAYIQELIAKKDQTFFWGFNIKSKNESYTLHVKQIKNLLKAKQIPYLFMNLSLNNKNFPCELMISLYKILFLMAEISKSNIYTQPWVDHLKTNKPTIPLKFKMYGFL